MGELTKALYSIRSLDDMAKGRSFIHQLNPMTKLFATGFFLVVTISFSRYELARLFPLILYPIFMIFLSDLSGKAVLKRVLWVEPIIIGIGILNPLLDQTQILVGGVEISRGWVTFFSIFIKGGLSVSAAVLLVATTGMNNIAAALRKLHVPKIFVAQLMLTYRYIHVLVEEVSRILTAFRLRSPGKKGMSLSIWGTLGGQLLLRTFDRAERVYQAMGLRGFVGEYPMTQNEGLTRKDLIFFLFSVGFILAVRFINLPGLLNGIFL